MMINRARRGPFTGLPMREVNPQIKPSLCHSRLTKEGYTSAVVDRDGMIMRLLRNDPMGSLARILASIMNENAAYALMVEGTPAANNVSDFEDLLQDMAIDALRQP